MTRSEAQPAWEEIVDTGFSDYTKLTREQRIWFNIEPLAIGGIIDHYVNSGADHNQHTIQDLEQLGFSHIAGLLRKINKLFKNEIPPIDINERNDEIVTWNDDTEILLEEIASQFWAESGNLEKALLVHINSTGIGVTGKPNRRDTESLSNRKSFHFSTLMFYVSPYVLWIFFCLIGFMIDKLTFIGDTRQWTHVVASLLLPSLVILFPLAVFIRFFAGKNTLRIWIIESVTLACFLVLYSI